MGSREVPYNEESVCDVCGHKGAYDFMGDYICGRCADKEFQSELDRLNKEEDK